MYSGRNRNIKKERARGRQGQTGTAKQSNGKVARYISVRHIAGISGNESGEDPQRSFFVSFLLFCALEILLQIV